MKLTTFAVVFVSILLLAPASWAGQGDTELQLQGALIISTGDFSDSGTASASYGWFWTEEQEIGVKTSTFFNSDGDLAGSLGPFYRYNFLIDDEMVPYVGGAATFGFGDSFVGDANLELEAGSRWYLDRNISFSVAAQTYYDIDQSDLADFVVIQFGFSYFWD